MLSPPRRRRDVRRIVCGAVAVFCGVVLFRLIGAVATGVAAGGATATGAAASSTVPLLGDVPIVFVSQQMPLRGTDASSIVRDQPGVGPQSGMRVAAPGQLVVREIDGTVRVLIDAAQPTAATQPLIDVSASAVSYDGAPFLPVGDVTGTKHIGPEDTFDGDYGAYSNAPTENLEKGWRPQRESNPRRRRERAVS